VKKKKKYDAADIYFLPAILIDDPKLADTDPFDV